MKAWNPCRTRAVWPLPVQPEEYFEVVGTADPVPFCANLVQAAQEESANAQVLFDMLGRFFNDPQSTTRLKSYRRPAYANAYFALGLLSYGAGQFREARHFLVCAVATDPRNGPKRQLIGTWLKSIWGAKFFDRIKGSFHQKATG